MITEIASSPDARRLVDTLPVQSPNAQPLKDLIAQDRPESENPVAKLFLTAMAWTLYIAALGSVVLLIRAMTHGYTGR